MLPVLHGVSLLSGGERPPAFCEQVAQVVFTLVQRNSHHRGSRRTAFKAMTTGEWRAGHQPQLFMSQRPALVTIVAMSRTVAFLDAAMRRPRTAVCNVWFLPGRLKEVSLFPE